MVSSRSFGERVTEKEHLAEALAMHATLAGERLRKEKLEAGGMSFSMLKRYSYSTFMAFMICSLPPRSG